MKLVNKKTKKAIEKSVSKALKQHGPKLVAAIAGSLASTLATLATTESADEPGKSNLSSAVDRAKKAVKEVVTDDAEGQRRQGGRESRPRAVDDLEGARRTERDPDGRRH